MGMGMINKMIRRKRLVSILVLFLFFLIILLYFIEEILMGAGNFLAPEGTGKADVIILEGDELIKADMVKTGMSLLSSGRADCLVIVLHQQPENRQNFALPDYRLLLAKGLENLGLRNNQFQIIAVPINHPITLTEAKIVIPNLSKSRVRRAILVTRGFHTRRSYWVYRQEGMSLGIEIIPHPYFISYQKEKWWKRIEAVDDFFQESLKIIYYFFRGYIPLKSLFGA